MNPQPIPPSGTIITVPVFAPITTRLFGRNASHLRIRWGHWSVAMKRTLLSPLEFTLTAGGQMQMSFSAVPAVPGRSYALEASTNLAEWETISKLTASNGRVQFVDMQAPDFGKRYYRTR